MKKIIMMLILMSATLSSHAQTFTTCMNDVRFTKTAVIPTMTLYSENTFSGTGKTGYNMFCLVNNTWAEAYPGVWWKPLKGTVIGLAAGIETGFETKHTGLRTEGSLIRFADTAKGFFRRILVKGFYEQGEGKDNYWWHASIQYQTKHWKLGVMSRRFYGDGPLVQYQYKKVSIGGAYLYDTEAKAIKPTVFVGWDF